MYPVMDATILTSPDFQWKKKPHCFSSPTSSGLSQNVLQKPLELSLGTLSRDVFFGGRSQIFGPPPDLRNSRRDLIMTIGKCIINILSYCSISGVSFQKGWNVYFLCLDVLCPHVFVYGDLFYFFIFCGDFYVYQCILEAFYC